MNKLSKWIITLFITMLFTTYIITSWGILIVLILGYNKINSTQIINNPIIEVKDSVINKKPKFFSQTPQEGLEEALVHYELKHKDIVFAQAILETGYFKSNVCQEYNNLFGLYNSKEKEYYKFKHWSESVLAYKELVQNKYQYPNDYYTFLDNLKYAEDKNYTRTLKELVNKIKDDKRRYTKGSSFT